MGFEPKSALAGDINQVSEIAAPKREDEAELFFLFKLKILETVKTRSVFANV